MKLTAWISVIDLYPVRLSNIEKLVRVVFGEKPMFKDHTPEEVFARLKKAGTDGAELLIPYYTTDKNIRDVKGLLRTNKVPVFSIHQSLSHVSVIELSEIERLCSVANLFSARVIVLHAGSLGKKLFDSSFISFLKQLEKKLDVIFGIENMPKTIYYLHRRYTYKAKTFADLLDRQKLSMTFDVTHLAQAGGDVGDFYIKNKQEIVNIHISDFKEHWLNRYFLQQKYTHLPLGKGTIPMQKLLTLLKETHYDGLVTMEIDGTLEEICESARMIKRLTCNP